MSEHPSHPDPWLDARLRNVPLPIGFLRRLEQVADPEMQRLDRALADVPLPEGFLERLADIARVERPSRARDLVARRPWELAALAASLLLLLGAGYVAYSRGGFAGRPGGGSVAGEGDLARGDRPAGSSADALSGVPGGSGAGANLPARDALGNRDGADGPFGSAGGFAEDEISNAIANGGMPAEKDFHATGDAFVDEETLRLDATDFAGDGGQPVFRLWPQPTPGDGVAGADGGLGGAGGGLANGGAAGGSGAGIAPVGPAVRPGDAREESSAGGRPALEVFTTDGRFEELPDLEAVQIALGHGVSPPIVAEYDLRFQLKYGQHPFVRPDANPLLASMQLPLVTSTAPWRRIARSVAEGRLPAPADVRTEDFLAALDYHFPPAPQAGLAIETAAGVAPLAEGGGMCLLQVAAHAGEIADEPRAPTHLTLVVDCSLAMRRSERWNAVGQALNQLVEHMQPADRLTLVAFSEEPETVIELQSRDELLADGSDKLPQALNALEARPAANLAAGVQSACRLASRVAAPAGAADAAAPARRMLILSGGRVDSGAHLSQRVQNRLAELAAAGLGVSVVDMGRAERAAGSLDAWAQAGATQLAKASDPNTLGWRLLEGLIGREPVVAQHVTLRIAFNPDVVAAYRLLGHERATLTGPAVASTEVDLRSGETATALFEIMLKSGLKNEVAVVESAWRRPNGGGLDRAKKQVVRSQFAVPFAQSPDSLQMAAVAALAAETLRGSYFAPANRSLARAADLAARVSKPVQNEPTFAELTQFIRRAEQLRTRRP